MFVGPLERVLYLRSLPAAEGLNSEDLVSLAQYAKERLFSSGEFLFRRGSPVESFFLIVEGVVAVRRGKGALQRLGPQETVGLLHLVAREPNGLEARAESNTLTLEFPAESQLELWESHFPILLSYARYLLTLRMGVLEQESGRQSLPSPTLDHGPYPLDLVDKLLLLSQQEIFQNCSLDGLAELCRHIHERRLEPGETLWSPGDIADSFLLLAEGELRQQRTQQPGRMLLPTTLAGLEEALTGKFRWYALEAKQESRILEIAVEPFLDILEDHFQMAVEFMANNARQLLGLLYD